MGKEEVDLAQMTTALAKEAADVVVVDRTNVEAVGDRRGYVRSCHMLPTVSQQPTPPSTHSLQTNSTSVTLLKYKLDAMFE